VRTNVKERILDLREAVTEGQKKLHILLGCSEEGKSEV
jgi:hypothetical protein